MTHRHQSSSNVPPGQTPTGVPEPADPAGEEQPQDFETVIRKLIRSNNQIKTWLAKAENTFGQQSTSLETINASLARIEGMLAALIASRGTQTPDIIISATQPSHSLPATPNPNFSLSARPFTTHPPRIGLEPNMPPAYSGDRATGRAFLNSCDAYYRLCSDDFRDTQTRIQWLLTFMNTDRAGRWANRIYSWEDENSGSAYFRDWDHFVAAFKEEFFPFHPEQQAIYRLESDGYWQRSRNMDAYVDEFRDLAFEAKYTDQRILVVKFRRGLKNSIQDEIATRSVGRPADDNLEAWISQARLVEQSLLEF